MRTLFFLSLCLFLTMTGSPAAAVPDTEKAEGEKKKEKETDKEKDKEAKKEKEEDKEKDKEKAKDAKPALEKLIELNAEQIFGCKASVRGDRLHLRAQNPADFARAFSGDGMGSPEDLKGINQKLIEKPEGGRIPHVAAIGRESGNWISRFDLSEDFTIRFDLRVPNIQRASQLNVVVNHDGKNYIATSFFQNASLILSGRAVKQAATPHRDFAGPPERWFDRKAGQVPVELNYAGGKFKVKLKDKDMVELDGVEKAAAGKVGFQFQKLAFVLSDFHANVKLDRKWCEDRLKELEAGGVLKVKDDAVAEKKAEDGKEGSGKKESARDREAEVDL